MRIEILVFRRNKRLFYQVWNFVRRSEQSPLFGKFINDFTFSGINSTDRGRFVLRQGRMAWQVAPIHPEHGSNGQSHHHDRQGDRAENRATYRENKSEHIALCYS